MIEFTAEIEAFKEMGEKTGWHYVAVPLFVAHQIKPDCKKSFRVRGVIDTVSVSGLALAPMGGGNFILPLKASLRKTINKSKKDLIKLSLEEDTDFKILIPEDLEICLLEEQYLMDAFLKLPKSHQNYFIKWIEEAKTFDTRVKRITQTVKAMANAQSYGEMIRANKGNSLI